jgi:hypothetical protein
MLLRGRKQELISMTAVLEALEAFLAAAASGDKKVFESFFADDVIYTGSSGARMDKAAVMKSIGARLGNGAKVAYRAEDITVHPYDNTVIVNFRMAVDGEHRGRRETLYFRNTGTFLKLRGKWQVVAWHATQAMPDGAES